MAVFGHYGPTVKIISFEPIFFWTSNFQGCFFTILSTISESFGKIKFQKIYQKKIKVSIMVISGHYGSPVKFLTFEEEFFWT